MANRPLGALIADSIHAHKRSLGRAIRNQLRVPESLPLIVLAIRMPIMALIAGVGIEVTALVVGKDFNSVLMASPKWVGLTFLGGGILSVFIWGLFELPQIPSTQRVHHPTPLDNRKVVPAMTETT